MSILKGLVSAKSGNNGAVTIGSTDSALRLLVLGSSCPSSVIFYNGPQTAVTFVPQRDREIIAIAVTHDDFCVRTARILEITRTEGKAHIDLESLVEHSREAIGQIIMATNCSWCYLGLVCESTLRKAPIWVGTKASPEQADVKNHMADMDGDAICNSILRFLTPSGTGPVPDENQVLIDDRSQGVSV
jgi:hypothetical protein